MVKVAPSPKPVEQRLSLGFIYKKRLYGTLFPSSHRGTVNTNTFQIKMKTLQWCGILIVLIATVMGLFEKWELISLDLRYQQASSMSRSDILLVVIDKASLKQYPKWPWPRHYYAEVISKLNQGGAKHVGLDFDFSSISRPSEDQQLVDAVSEAGNVVLSAFHEDKI
ncbi:MAG: CHASE2 domain-containing protein [Nitrospiria bacterium]